MYPDAYPNMCLTMSTILGLITSSPGPSPTLRCSPALSEAEDDRKAAAMSLGTVLPCIPTNLLYSETLGGPTTWLPCVRRCVRRL